MIMIIIIHLRKADRFSADQGAYKNSCEEQEKLNKKECNYSPPHNTAECRKGQKSQQENVTDRDSK